MSIYDELNYTLYNNITPYTNCDVVKYLDNAYPHTNVTPALLDSLFNEYLPESVLEIGSMVGGSCIRMIESLNRCGLHNSSIVCIDPFTGDMNMWGWESKNEGYKFLQLENGIPTIYKRFLANTYEYRNKIVPINCTALTGIKLLARIRSHNRISSLPSIIFLDSAHYKNETYNEIIDCYEQLMRPNMVLFGDDWGWADVQHDVIRAAKHFELNIKMRNKIQNKLLGSDVIDNVLVYDNQWMLFT